MDLTINREILLKSLKVVVGVIEKRQTLPILANVLLSVEENQLAMTATDLEIELVGLAKLEDNIEKTTGRITVSGYKFIDIVRNLPDGAIITIREEHGSILIRSGNSRFNLTSLPASDFPCIENLNAKMTFPIEQQELRHLLRRTYFSMAQQDVRYYLNGMFLESRADMIRAVATDGHRLALNTFTRSDLKTTNTFQVIIPRKGVIELMRLLEENEDQVEVSIAENHLRVISDDFIFTSKLVDGRFPDYNKVIPKGGDKELIIDRDLFKESLNRAAILSNEKFRSVRFELKTDKLHVLANNYEEGEAEEKLDVNYNGEDFEVAFNVNYLLDILNTVESGDVRVTFKNEKNSVLIEEAKSHGDSVFVVMPMRL